jgi:carbonic anhydrase
VTGIKDSNNNLTIKEVRVVGHTGCAGVQACYNVVNNLPSLPPDSVLWSWLGPLRAYAHAHKGQTLDWLTKENVRIQMRNVKAMLLSLERAEVKVKGFLYDIEKREFDPVPAAS